MNNVDPALIKGLAIGLGASAVGAIGRNPEMQGRILSTAFVMAGLVDAVLAFVLLIVFTT
jgi:F0F1-type ATP synthase membrane subunit c/vacuolar-type H+-ATPase subunit K